MLLLLQMNEAVGSTDRCICRLLPGLALQSNVLQPAIDVTAWLAVDRDLTTTLTYLFRPATSLLLPCCCATISLLQQHNRYRSFTLLVLRLLLQVTNPDEGD